MLALTRSCVIAPLVTASLGLAASIAPEADGKKVAKYKICGSAREELIPADGSWAGCFVEKSSANVAFAQKAVDKAFTDPKDPAGDGFWNLPEGSIDCKEFFDKKDRRSGLLHCIRTFAWHHVRNGPDHPSHGGTCTYGVSMTYVVAGTKRKGGRFYARYKPSATPYGYALAHSEFKLYFGTSNVPKGECKSLDDHNSGGFGTAPLVPEDPLDDAPLVPGLDDA